MPVELCNYMYKNQSEHAKIVSEAANAPSGNGSGSVTSRAAEPISPSRSASNTACQSHNGYTHVHNITSIHSAETIIYFLVPSGGGGMLRT